MSDAERKRLKREESKRQRLLRRQRMKEAEEKRLELAGGGEAAQ